jgi:hypothetical protein
VDQHIGYTDTDLKSDQLMCSCHILLLPIRYVHSTTGAFGCAGNNLTLFTLEAQVAKTVIFVLTLYTVYKQTFRVHFLVNKVM